MVLTLLFSGLAKRCGGNCPETYIAPWFWFCGIFSWFGTQHYRSWWRHQMETFSVSLALCGGNLLVAGVFHSQRPVTRSFDIFSDLRPKNVWANNRDAGDLRRHRAHRDVIVMIRQSYFTGMLGAIIAPVPMKRTSWIWVKASLDTSKKW